MSAGPGINPLERVAEALLAARAAGTRVAALTEVLTVDDAYRVQDIVAAGRGPVAGWKIGCTSAMAQAYLGIGHPFAGAVHRADIHASPARLSARAFRQRGIEGEFALRLGRDLTAADGPFDAEGLRDAVDAVIPAIEVIEPRFANWREVGAAATIADHGAHGALVLGEAVPVERCPDLRQARVRVTIDGTVTGEGEGSAVLGDPLAALAWLANHLTGRGAVLPAGAIVSTGTCTGYVEAGPEAIARAEFGPYGDVGLSFS
ncbi:MAG: fumarylacetoacetate hydrolase family protein [Azospirillaceae bacterium]